MSKPQKGNVERRTVFAGELRTDSQGDEMALIGRACSYGVLSQDLGGFREVISPGAFDRSLASGSDIKCLFNHDPNQILGRTKNRTLQVTSDDKGLAFRCDLNPASQSHRDIHAAIKRGDISECSFAFSADPDDGDEWDEAEENGVRFARRTLRNVTLMDVSAVCNPAYENATSVSARSLPQYGAKDFFAYVQRRAKELGREIALDEMLLINDRAWRQVDELNRREAAEIGRQIAADDAALRSVTQADDELRRRMELSNGRLRK